jgi:hypothetical protein
VIEDADAAGSWRAFMVTFPLKASVRELRKAQVALPAPMCTYDHYMNDDERTLRDSAGVRAPRPAAE